MSQPRASFRYVAEGGATGYTTAATRLVKTGAYSEVRAPEGWGIGPVDACAFGNPVVATEDRGPHVPRRLRIADQVRPVTSGAQGPALVLTATAVVARQFLDALGRLLAR